MSYYALWYKTHDGEKDASAISLNKDSLLKLHDVSILDTNCLFHQYKYAVRHIYVEPITCYIYNNNKKCLELYTNEKYIGKENGNFYAINYNPFSNMDLINNESLVYLSKEDYEDWRKCNKDKNNNICQFSKNNTYPLFFYNELISNVLIPDIYYEEGIMNA
jgi:hypothetical protein